MKYAQSKVYICNKDRSLNIYVTVIAIYFVILIFGSPAIAANIYSEQLPDTTWKIVYEGKIVKGDADSFRSVLRSTKNKGKVSSVHLNSTGGLIYQAWDIAKNIEYEGLVTVVERNAHCESACFLMFIAGYPRIASADAHVGVHRATLNGKDDDDTTQEVIDMAVRLGVVNETVLRRLTAAAPNRMNYLTVNQLKMIQADVRP